MVTTVGKMLRALNAAMAETLLHPLVALRDWWEDGTGILDYPPRRYTGGRR